MCDSFLVISNGPYLLGLSLAVGCVVFRFVASNQTFCFSLKGLYFIALIVSCCAWVIACCAACLMALVWASLESIAGAREWVFPVWAYGMCPMISSKGAFPVAALGQALWVYCASRSHFALSICAPFPNLLIY